MKSVFNVLALFIALNVSLHAQTPANGTPYIRLEKSTFAAGEAVFFWVGVQKTGNAAISKEYWDTCRMTIIRPDRSEKTYRLAWPLDGPVGSGWTGGCGLGEKAKPGRYLLVFEFAGQKTVPTPLIVKDIPALEKIKANFIFSPSVKTANGYDTPVTLSVINNTDQTIRFPHRDGTNGMVSVYVAKPDGSFQYSGFYPADKLLDRDESKMPTHGFDNFSWKDARDLPTITLKPGEAYTQRLSLHDFVSYCNMQASKGAGSPITKGDYQVTFSTMLPTLIGEEQGPYALVSPVHVAVSETATCMITP